MTEAAVVRRPPWYRVQLDLIVDALVEAHRLRLDKRNHEHFQLWLALRRNLTEPFDRRVGRRDVLAPLFHVYGKLTRAQPSALKARLQNEATVLAQELRHIVR